MNTSAIQSPTGFIITTGDGKSIAIPESFRMVKIAEKKEGKGKGKTVAFCLLPSLLPFSTEDLETCTPLLNELLSELQRDILTRMQRDGSAAVSVEEIGIPACVAEWTNRTFSAETVGAWFDAEVQELLAFKIATAKGWNVDEIESNPDQVKFLETKCNAYRASYVEVSKKFPSLNPTQCEELLRVLNLLESTGPIASRIREKITPKQTSETLGF